MDKKEQKDSIRRFVSRIERKGEEGKITWKVIGEALFCLACEQPFGSDDPFMDLVTRWREKELEQTTCIIQEARTSGDRSTDRGE